MKLGPPAESEDHSEAISVSDKTDAATQLICNHCQKKLPSALEDFTDDWIECSCGNSESVDTIKGCIQESSAILLGTELQSVISRTVEELEDSVSHGLAETMKISTCRFRICK